MTDFYDRWLKIDPWNSELAAYIVNGKDPDLYGGKVKFPNKIEDNYKINRKEWQRMVCWTHHIFESARKDFWKRYVDLDSDYYFFLNHPKEASPNAFISFAIDKELDLPPELLEKWEKLNLLVIPDKNEADSKWKKFAWDKAKEILEERPLLSIEQIGDKVAPFVKEAGLKTKRGIFPAGSYIARHALKGLKPKN